MDELTFSLDLDKNSNVKANLSELNLVNDDMCKCGDLETVGNVLMDC